MMQAHLGWAHWLNQHAGGTKSSHLTQTAERNYRIALAADSSNVYANAMLGNWMTMNGGNLADAVQHFNTAVATGKARSFVQNIATVWPKESRRARRQGGPDESRNRDAQSRRAFGRRGQAQGPELLL